LGDSGSGGAATLGVTGGFVAAAGFGVFAAAGFGFAGAVVVLAAV